MKYVIDLDATPRGLFLVNFIHGECTLGVLNCTVKERHHVFKRTKPQRSSAWKALICYIKNMELIWVLWGCKTVPETNFHLVLKHYSTLKATHLITLYWQKAPKCRSRVMTASLWCRRHTAPIIQSQELTTFVSFHFRWEKDVVSSQRDDEAFWSSLFQGPVFLVFITVCGCVCVFALCCFLWEHCCKRGLLTELELSFHTGGN